MIVGTLEVTLTFRVNVSDLEHYEAETLEEAAENLDTWYSDGSADLVDDFSCSEHSTVTVKVVNE